MWCHNSGSNYGNPWSLYKNDANGGKKPLGGKKNVSNFYEAIA